MPDKLIDTNILVYAYDISEGEKHEIAKDILRQIWINGNGVVCLQNLMEFFVIITKKVENPVDIMTAKDIVHDFIRSERWTIIDRDADTFLSAIELISEFNIHLWDAVIAACMKESNIAEIVTENVKDFEKVPDIRVIFPF